MRVVQSTTPTLERAELWPGQGPNRAKTALANGGLYLPTAFRVENLAEGQERE
jgi:hypothetical protein